MKRFLKYLRVRSGNLFLYNKSYFFLNGLFVAILFYFYTENVYERQIFTAIADNIRTTLAKDGHLATDSIVLRSLDMTYYLERRRFIVFGNSLIKGIKAELIQPVTFDLMTGRGSCASSSFVLGRILDEFGIPIRFGQMMVNGTYGGHIILEAFVNGEWKVLDAFYNLKFIRPDGQLAQFKDVQQNWAHYKQQVPLEYNSSYRYEAIQYTNWNKIPILLPALKKLLTLCTGADYVSNISLRVLFLKKFDVLFKVFLFFYIMTMIARVYIYRKSSKAKLKLLAIHSLHRKNDTPGVLDHHRDQVKAG